MKIKRLSIIELVVFLGGRNAKEKKWKQCEKGENYRHLNKVDILDEVNGNVNKVMV